MKARDIMTDRPEYVTTNDSVQRAAKIMRDIDVGLVPVVDDESSCRLRGVITDRDITVRCVASGRDGDCLVGDLMSVDLVTARPDDDIDRVMSQMMTEQVRRIPIVDDSDRLMGIVAQADIALEVPDEDVGDLVEKISEPSEPESRRQESRHRIR